MDHLALEEQLFLLTRDPGTGRDRSVHSDPLLAGAVLIELVRAGALTVDRGRVTVRPVVGLLGPHQQAALELIAGARRRRTPSSWADALPRTLVLHDRVGVALAARGVVDEGRDRVFLLPVRTFRPRDPRLVEHLWRVAGPVIAGDDPAPPPQVRLLAGLLCRTGLAEWLVPGPRRWWQRISSDRADAILTHPAAAAGLPPHVAAAQTAVVHGLITAHDHWLKPDSTGGGGS